MAETEVFQVRWSERILDEALRNIKANRPGEEAAVDRRFGDMRAAFDEAMVTGHEPLEPVMRNAPEDRHVLAAAIVGRADVIVTKNLDDFPAEALDPYGIDAQHPDEFLCNQWELDEEAMAGVMDYWLTDLAESLTLEQLLGRLERDVPRFCQLVRTAGLDDS
jgi:hypothetical protein